MINLDEFYINMRKYPILFAINIFREIEENGYPNYKMIIELCRYPYDEEKMIIRCKNVKEVKISNIDGMYCSFLEIIDISNRQLEDIKYSVKDVENEMISFLCNEIFFEIKK